MNTEKELLSAFLEPYHDKYNEALCMITMPSRTNGYHTFLPPGTPAHNILIALQYALAVLDAGEEQYYQRVRAIVKKIISLQDADENHETYGLWAYYLEEPLEKMAPPDYNWADFCGKLLLQIVRHYGVVLGEQLKKEAEQSIRRAMECIIRRNVSPDYTNIAVMGSYVAIISGEYFQEPRFFEYGKELLNKLVSFTVTHGAFNEYNSPVYSVLAVEDASLLYREVQDARCREMAYFIIETEWDCIARHYHKGTGQWAGPHGRSYSDLAGDKLWTSLQVAMNHEIRFVDHLQMDFQLFRFRMECPEKYKRYFMEEQITYEREMVSRGFMYPHFNMVQTATNYNTPDFTLGTFNRSEMWNQIRPLISYFGTKENPACLRLRLLHDFYDFSDGELFMVQDKNAVLGVMNFADDRGDTHVCLDMIKDGVVELSDMRIRLQVTGNLEGIQWEEQPGRVIMKKDNITAVFMVPYCKFGDYEITFQLGQENDTAFFDVVLYSGERKTICLRELKECVCVMALYLDTKPCMPEVPAVFVNENHLCASWKINGKELMVTSEVKAAGWEHMMYQARQYIDGKWIVYDAKV